MLKALRHPKHALVSAGAISIVVVSLAVPGFASPDYSQPGNQASSSEAVNDSTRYSSCKKLRVVFPRGVVKNKRSQDRAVAQKYGQPTVNSSAYKANKTLDKNGNRAVCEVSAAKARKNFRAELLTAKLPKVQATQEIEQAGYEWRVGSVNGEAMLVTQDYRINRLTLSLNDGIVTEAKWG
jgi:hypothetical protein